MSNNQPIKRLELRMKLLQTHVEEQKILIAIEKKERAVLRDRHFQEKNASGITEKRNSPKWIDLVARQAGEITRLSRINSLKRKVILDRQREEALQLEQRLLSQ